MGKRADGSLVFFLSLVRSALKPTRKKVKRSLKKREDWSSWEIRKLKKNVRRH